MGLSQLSTERYCQVASTLLRCQKVSVRTWTRGQVVLTAVFEVLLSPAQCWDSGLKVGHGSILSDPFKLIIHSHNTVRHCLERSLVMGLRTRFLCAFRPADSTDVEVRKDELKAESDWVVF